MAGSCERVTVTIEEVDGHKREGGLDDLINYLKSLGFPSLDEGDSLRNYLEAGAGGWARYELLETNRLLKIEVPRDDGKITKAILGPDGKHPDLVYLQVASGIEEGKEPPLGESELDGTFPLPITSFGVGFSNWPGKDFIVFYGGSTPDDRSAGIGITENGRVSLIGRIGKWMP